jgi:hypothetical protein
MAASSKKIVSITITTIMTLIIAIGAILKILKLPAIMVDFSRLGVAQYTQFLGVIELIFLALVLYRKTMKIGFILLCGYFGGAMATHLSHNQMITQPLVPLLIICLSVLLRDKTVFYPTPN